MKETSQLGNGLVVEQTADAGQETARTSYETFNLPNIGCGQETARGADKIFGLLGCSIVQESVGVSDDGLDLFQSVTAEKVTQGAEAIKEPTFVELLNRSSERENGENSDDGASETHDGCYFGRAGAKSW